jgi:hypothetical protein
MRSNALLSFFQMPEQTFKIQNSQRVACWLRASRRGTGRRGRRRLRHHFKFINDHGHIFTLPILLSKFHIDHQKMEPIMG